MFTLGPVGFLSPLLLLGLLALPVLWWLLRAVPPAPIRRLFPAVVLLLGLKDPESTPDKTPWWLLLLRMLAVALMIAGFAGPVLNPKGDAVGRGPLVILSDASWASARGWARRQEKIDDLLDEAARKGRPAAVLALTDPPAEAARLALRDARDWQEIAGALSPAPWEPDYPAFEAWLEAGAPGAFDTVWLSDGLAREGRAELARALMARGNLRVIETGSEVLALGPPAYRDGRVTLAVLRPGSGGSPEVVIEAYGPDPAGIDRRLASTRVTFDEGALRAEAGFDLPAELRNRISRFRIAGSRSAGAMVLADDALKRRKVALFAGARAGEGAELVSPLFYLRKALEPSAELIEAPMREALLADPDVVVLADVASMTPVEIADLSAWVKDGGLLLRFAGPRLAAAGAGTAEDPLLPVRLRAGGRNVGGAMSWGSPKQLRPFAKGTPFFGLTLPADVTVSSQVLAQPGPDLSAATIASLQDGTPLVTQSQLGDGRVVLFHVTANAEWSSLPLSGLFVEMLERLAVSTRSGAPRVGDLEGQVWQPDQVMDAFANLRPGDSLIPVAGEALAGGIVGPDLLPGTYVSGERQVALNVIAPDRVLARADWPEGVLVESMTRPGEKPLKAFLLALALALLALDVLGTLLISGRLRGPREVVAALALLLAAGMVWAPDQGLAQSDDARALRATQETVLAYVRTGDARLDAMSEAGLRGLSRILTERTAVEPSAPIGVDLERDELAFFPLLYWPISEVQPIPSEASYARLNAFLRGGGMILFDTRDSDLGAFGSGTPNGRRLQQLAAALDIPALEPVPEDHVLTRSFYLLQDFPGRYARAPVWVEAAPKDAVRIEGMPFRNLNDGVSPVVIGGNDWAAAWAMDAEGRPLYPVGRGYAGDRQREMAYRFGVNLVMYVLTGNYKSDQVHVPALLERLGQ